MRKIRFIVFTLISFLFAFTEIKAQEGAHTSYSPYSVYGIGELNKDGNAFTRSMGGVGIATRNKRYINFANPASITARDTLSFMADFGLYESNEIYKQGNFRSANNTFNISDFVVSMPIWRSSAFMVGIAPFSDVGYDFSSIEDNPDIIGNTNNISYQSYGEGGIYQFFVGAGATFWKRLSIGAELIYYFGTIDKITNTLFSDTAHRSVNAGYTLQLRGLTGKFGIQYEQPLGGNVSMIIGATYRPKTSITGYSYEYSYAVTTELTDTLKNNEKILSRGNGLNYGDELGVGISFKGGEKWSAEFNYLRSDWKKSGFDENNGFAVTGASGVAFKATASQSFRAGFEVVPNRNDIRYYHKRMAYRGGVYYDQSYFKLDGNTISTYGVTLGVTLPVFRWYNGLSLGMEFGTRGSTKGNMVRENFVNFSVGFNIHDIWFQKPRYN